MLVFVVLGVQDLSWMSYIKSLGRIMPARSIVIAHVNRQGKISPDGKY